MKLDTIAECVEDEQTLNILKEIGIDYAQGYHLGRPQAIREEGSEQLTVSSKQ
jgi:Amt family ammonium transporter